MQEQPTAHRCIHERILANGETRFKVKVLVGRRRISITAWTLEEALEHREVLWRRSVEAKRLRRVRRANGTDKIEVIYFVKAGDDGPIKLGRTRAELVQRRLANLQIASHVELRLLGTLESDSTGERELHRRMAHLRIRGEWFADTPELRDVLIRRPGWVRGSNLAPGGRQHDSKAADLQGEVVT